METFGTGLTLLGLIVLTGSNFQLSKIRFHWRFNLFWIDARVRDVPGAGQEKRRTNQPMALYGATVFHRRIDLPGFRSIIHQPDQALHSKQYPVYGGIGHHPDGIWPHDPQLFAQVFPRAGGQRDQLIIAVIRGDHGILFIS